MDNYAVAGTFSIDQLVTNLLGREVQPKIMENL